MDTVDEPKNGRASASGAKRRVEVSDLLGEAREIILLHNGSEYRLRVTSNDKLILTK